MLVEAVEHLVRGIVDHPDDVSVRSRALRRGKILDVRVHPDDLGRVIGRSGRTAQNLRTVVGALAQGQQHRVEFEAHGAARRSRRNGSSQ
ncbi:MAG: RNA-binding protein [Streptosporangiales bacterium]|nr:RNA-binding protein [Streptosporangiales bacterium]